MNAVVIVGCIIAILAIPVFVMWVLYKEDGGAR